IDAASTAQLACGSDDPFFINGPIHSRVLRNSRKRCGRACEKESKQNAQWRQNELACAGHKRGKASAALARIWGVTRATPEASTDASARASPEPSAKASAAHRQRIC